MERRAELELIRRFLEHLERGTTDRSPEVLRVAAERYTSEAHRRDEERRWFRRRPVVVGLSADLPAPGDFLTTELCGVPLFLLRQGDGGVRAFVNGCRHRGSRLLEGRGCLAGGALRCPFHAWTYGADGRLLATPNDAGGFAELDRETLRLHERPVLEHLGLLLIRLEGAGPIDPGSALRGLEPDLRALDLASYHHFDSRRSAWRCNWKLILETFLESYHVFSLHRETVHPWYFSVPMVYDALGLNLRFPVARRSLAELRDRPEGEWRLADHATLQWWLAPNALLSYTRDYLLLWRFQSPEPGRCLVETSLYTQEPVATGDRPRLEEALALQLRVTGDEDFPAQERAQSVLASGALPEVVFGRHEVAAAHFHRVLAER